MKKFIKSNPILSYVILTFSISWFCWFISLIISLPKDIYFGVNFVGILGPPIAAFILIHVISDEKIKIHSKKLFWAFFVLTSLLLIWRFYIVENGGADWGGFYPKLSDFSLFGIILPLLCCLFLGLNASNAINKNLKENYLKSLLFEKGKIKWYLFAILFYPILYASSFLIGKLLGFETSESLITIDLGFIASFLLIVFVAGGTEEFGWRGFLQKEFQKKYNPLLTTLFIALAWATWHLPLHYNGVYSTEGFFHFLPRFITTFQLSILFTWLFNKSKYSILAVMILHGMNNTVGQVFGSSYMPIMVMAIMIMLTFIFDNKMWKRKNYAQEIYSNEVK